MLKLYRMQARMNDNGCGGIAVTAEGHRKEGSGVRSGGRIILHLDRNAFYCSVHEAEEPERYAGKPIAVAGSVEERRGVIVTSSYAARRMGVRTGMTFRQGLKACPQLIIIPPD